ncbi:acetyltransferase [Vallitalea longa]|uniref:Acetyltransferase n=1 Tax=Vallitalea longa TaxID=2936439 RepID=A0A9W5Y9C5_9FIRM|nr:GNAT family N-acetyltransferase [Vallitalea longa]GKX29662.1 acetyltransferase [Vallitalea longa]
MYDIKKCSQVSDSIIYKAFTDGFADYMIHVEMDEDFFINRFFGQEGNDRELSFIAFKEDKPVGITLGGIKYGENFKTLRCGGMSIIPSERGTGLANELMGYYESEARKIGCKQLFLEVINGNDRAINFYKKIGYEKVYDLTYRKLELTGDNPIKNITMNDIEVEEMTYEDISSLREIDFSHLPWQADFPYFKNLSCRYYGIEDKNKIVAGIVASDNRLIYLWVHPNYRNKGYAKVLLNKVIDDLKPDELNVMYSNNSQAHTFANYLKMKMKEFGQYEMYKLLL